MRKIKLDEQRKAVAKSLHDLGLLFGKRPPDTNDNGLREQAEVGTDKSKLHDQDSSMARRAQGGLK